MVWTPQYRMRQKPLQKLRSLSEQHDKHVWYASQVRTSTNVAQPAEIRTSTKYHEGTLYIIRPQPLWQPLHTTHCPCCSSAPVLTIPPLVPDVEHCQCKGGRDGAFGHRAVIQVALLGVPLPCRVTNVLAQDNVVHPNRAHAAKHFHLRGGRGGVGVCVSRAIATGSLHTVCGRCVVGTDCMLHFASLRKK